MSGCLDGTLGQPMAKPSMVVTGAEAGSVAAPRATNSGVKCSTVGCASSSRHGSASSQWSSCYVVTRLERRELLARFPCPEDARATNVRLTRAGRSAVRGAAPGHVRTVREHVLDALTPQQVRQRANSW